MRKIGSFCAILAAALLMAGCNKFEPTESTIFITSEGEVKSAIMESFEKSYYDFEELSEEVEKEVKSYCLDVNQEDVITVESLTEENYAVALFMNYRTVGDYEAFNEVLLFNGTYEEAILAGHIPGDLYDAEGVQADVSKEELAKLKVIVTEESINVQTSGRIKYVSNNVTVVDKKLAKALEAGVTHPAFILYK